MQKTILPALLFVLTLSIATRGHAEDLRFATIDVAPWASEDPATHETIGLFPAIVGEIERRTGHRIVLSLHPFVRIDHDLESGEQDCAAFLWNDYRLPYVEKGELVSVHATGVLARRGITLKTIDDLRGLTISVLRGMKLDPRIDGNPEIREEFDPDYLTGLHKIAHHRLDAIVGALVPIHYLARQQGLDANLGDELRLGEAPIVLQCSKKSKNINLMPQIDQAIRDMKNDGTMERLKKENFFM